MIRNRPWNLAVRHFKIASIRLKLKYKSLQYENLTHDLHL